MKQLIDELTNERLPFFFEGSDKKILEWVNNNLEVFNLNETHSCEASEFFNREIHINGDEDLKILIITEVPLIKL